jgi:pimeloyl-ACP methyl ester carboxylesterase
MNLARFRIVTALAIGALVIGTLYVTYRSFRHDIDAARDRVSSGSQVVDTPCGLIEYAVAGKGPPVLMVHGAGGGFDQGLEAGQPLAEQGFQLIAMSRFGYLRTPLAPDASPVAQADAHVCLLDALGLRKVVVFGASIGAPSTVQLCLRHAERCAAMVLLVPMLFSPSLASDPPQEPSAFVQFLADAALRSDFVFWAGTKIARRELVETLLATPYAEVENASSVEQDRVFRFMHHILPISQRAGGLENDISTDLPRYPLEQISVSTLVISTETDLFGTFENGRYTAEQIPGARFLGYPTGGHVWVEREMEIFAEIRAFMDNDASW